MCISWPANEIMEHMRHFYEITPGLLAFMDGIDWTPFCEFLL